MEALKEVTVWADSKTGNHTYLLDGTKMVAYIPFGKRTPFYFKNPIVIDKRGRKFKTLKKNPFKVEVNRSLREVQGSKGNVYYVDDDEKTCTCPGFTFRGQCKHLKDKE